MRLLCMLMLAPTSACVVEQGNNDGLFDCEVAGGCGPAMLPGQGCLECHHASATGSSSVPALPFSAAGTVYAAPSAAPDAGAAGVEVVLLDADGKEVVTWSNAWGNFYTEEPLRFPLRRAQVTRDGQSLSMPFSSHIPDTPGTPPFPPPPDSEDGRAYYAPSGRCNTCHVLPPAGGAPGRIYTP